MYLIVTNLTTTELMYRSKAKYLHKIKGNPFSYGPIQNIAIAFKVPPTGQ